VHAYFCGHDHIGLHLRKSGQFTEYFVVGAGTMTDTVSKTSGAEIIWAGPNYASFAAANASIHNLTIAYRDTNGTVRYTYTLNNPNPLFKPTIIDGGSGGGGGGGGGGTDGGDGGGGGSEGEGDGDSGANASDSFFSWATGPTRRTKHPIHRLRWLPEVLQPLAWCVSSSSSCTDARTKMTRTKRPASSF